MDWRDAVSFAMSQAPGKRAGGTQYPQITNRDASGLILFARQAMEYAIGKGHPVKFDWYAFALAALGWRKSGDVFDMSTKQQISTYPASAELWSALQALATQLDEARVEFELIRDPAGTEGTYQRLAHDAWAFMQRESPADALASQVTAAERKKASTPSVPAARQAISPAAREGSQDNGGGWGTIALIALVAYAALSD